MNVLGADQLLHQLLLRNDVRHRHGTTSKQATQASATMS
jgi:hypothetical protein